MKKFSVYILTFIFLVLPFWVISQIPDGYYNTANGKKGEALKTALYNIIKGHTQYDYRDLWNILSVTDQDPNDSNNVILIYTGISRAKSKHGGDAGDWNREHVWAKSHGGFGTNPPAGTDVQHIRPADVKVNNLRASLDFDNGGHLVSGTTGCYMDDDSFEPRDAVKGDVARMIFYMATRYEGDNGEPDLEVVDRINTTGSAEMGKLSTLLKWNLQDPPDDFEKRRNNIIYSNYQHNRNPFIDHPEYVTAIWGGPTAVRNNPDLLLEVYPNPVVNQLHIVNGEPDLLKYKIISAEGRVLQHGVVTKGNYVIRLNLKYKGLLLLVITNKKDSWYKIYKLMKTNSIL